MDFATFRGAKRGDWRLARFWRDHRGGVAVSMAGAVAPMILLTLGAMDYSRASQAKSDLQDALDSATLAVGRATTVDPIKMQQIGESVLKGNLDLAHGLTYQESSFTPVDGRVVSMARLKVDTVAAGLVVGDVTVKATSEAERARRKLEIALVLDNTGSMAGTKLATLKTAATNFVGEMEKAVTWSGQPGIVKIGVAPFSMTVNVGPEYKTADWIDGHLDGSGNAVAPVSPIHQEIFTSTANRFTLLKQMGVSWGGCVEERAAPYDVTEAAPNATIPGTLFVPYFAPDEPDTSNGGFYNNYLTDASGTSGWQQRQGKPTKYVRAPKTGTNGVGYQYGPNAGCALAPLLRLTSDFDAVRSRINAMTAVGDTNIPLGLAWGWRLLTPLAPFRDGAAYGTEELDKVAILMTDGQNTITDTSNSNDSIYSGIGYIWQNRVGVGSGSSAAARRTALDNRLTLLCQNMKAKGITLYTVRVEVNDGENAVLKGCATKPEMFYDVQSVSELSDVFKAIAGSIQKLRLVK